MIISNKHKYIFIHIPKTGGLSIRDSLEKRNLYNPISRLKGIIEYDLIKKPINLFNKTIYPGHMTAIKTKTYLNQKFGDFFKFAFVRNPWDIMVSYYFFIKQMPYKNIKIYLKTKNFNFHQFTKWILAKKILNPQYQFISDNKNKLIVDFIGKFENIENDFKKICSILKIKRKLKHLNKTKHKNYRKYYDKESKELVAKYFKKDIEMFNYIF